MAELSSGQIKSKRIVYLVLSTISLLFLGLIYAFSMFRQGMVDSFGLEPGAVGLTFNIMMITFCIGAVIGSQIEKKLDVKGTLAIAAVMFLIGFAGTGLFANGNIAAVYIFYGVIGGLGVGIGYNTVIATTNVWFPDMIGIASGVLMMGFGLGALIFGTISVQFVYPAIGNLSPILVALGVIAGVIIFLEAIILKRAPKDIASILGVEKSGGSDYDPGEEDSALKTPTFYVYWIWAFIVIAIGLATLGSGASDGQEAGFDAGFATTLVGIVSAFNGVGRVAIGAIYDRTNVKITMLIDGIIALVATVSIVTALNMHIPVLYAVGALCCGLCYGGVPVIASAMSKQRFGSKNYPLNLSLANFAIVWGSIANVIIQNLTGGARISVFIVLIVMAIIAIADVLPFSKMWDRDQKMLAERRATHEA